MDHYSICGKTREGVSKVFLTKPVGGQWKLGGLRGIRRLNHPTPTNKLRLASTLSNISPKWPQKLQHILEISAWIPSIHTAYGGSPRSSVAGSWFPVVDADFVAPQRLLDFLQGVLVSLALTRPYELCLDKQMLPGWSARLITSMSVTLSCQLMPKMILGCLMWNHSSHTYYTVVDLLLWWSVMARGPERDKISCQGSLALFAPCRGYSKDFFQLHKVHSKQGETKFWKNRGPTVVYQMIQTCQYFSKSTLSNLSDIRYLSTGFWPKCEAFLSIHLE